MSPAVIGREQEGHLVDGRFPLIQWLGGTELSAVYLTQIVGQAEEKAAIKLIPADAEADNRLALWAEAKSLSHPHLMRLIDSGRCIIEGNPWIYVVTEYADENLAQILPERALTPAEVAEMLQPALDALGYLHGKQLVHGHLKPSNLMVVGEQLKLSVDDVVRAEAQNKALVRNDLYEAPECGEGRFSPAADSWALGITIVEALTQHPPSLSEHAGETPRIAESLPEPFSSIVRGCLRRDPERRWTLLEVKARLDGRPAPPAAVPPAKPAAPPNQSGNQSVPPLAASKAEHSRPEPKPAPSQSPAVSAQRHASSGKTASSPRSGLLILAVALVIVIAAIAFFRMRSPSTQPPAASPQQTAANSGNSATAPATADQTSKGVVKGGVAERVMPDVAPRATQTIHGTITVRVEVTVNPEGSVSDATFKARGPSNYFANAALEAARKWRFTPTVVGGRPVAGVWILQFQFRRSGTEATAEESSRSGLVGSPQ